MKTSDTPKNRAELETLLAASSASASPAVADSVAWPPRRMTAAELFDFWQRIRLVAMATVGPQGQPHLAPVHAVLEGSTLTVLVYEDAVRRRDLVTNARVAFTAWDHDGAVVVLYGRGEEVAGSLRSARSGASGRERHVVEVRVSLTRVYGMTAKAQ